MKDFSWDISMGIPKKDEEFTGDLISWESNKGKTGV